MTSRRYSKSSAKCDNTCNRLGGENASVVLLTTLTFIYILFALTGVTDSFRYKRLGSSYKRRSLWCGNLRYKSQSATAGMILTLLRLQYAPISFFVLFLLYKVWLRTWVFNPKLLPFPPGPKGLPIIGNLRALPSSHSWLYLADLKKTLGMWFSPRNQHFTVPIQISR